MSVETSRSTAEEGRDGSLSTVQIAAIVLAIGVLLMVTTGVLAYATQAPFGLDFRGTRRRLRRSWRWAGALDAVRTGGRRNEMRRIASRLRDHTAKTQRTPNELAAVEEALASYLAQRAAGETTTNDELESLKAKLDVHPAVAISAEHELEILKAKRGKLSGRVDVGRPDEVETLKAKRAGDAGATAGETVARNALVPESVERGVPPKTRAREAAGGATKHRHKQVGRR